MAIELVFLRHGQSVWNHENRFTGWTDVGLTEQGEAEARQAGRLLSAAGVRFDLAHTSRLQRATATLELALGEMGQSELPVERYWRLNERHYGALQGLNKKETTARYGAEQVHLWRRSYDVRPPALELDDPRHPRMDEHYADLDQEALPGSECLKDVIDRVLPYWSQQVVPLLKAGRSLLMVAHGNSLRALVMHLDQISKEEISALNIPTGIPLVYQLDEMLRPVGHRYLGDPEAARKAAEAVSKQAGR